MIVRLEMEPQILVLFIVLGFFSFDFLLDLCLFQLCNFRGLSLKVVCFEARCNRFYVSNYLGEFEDLNLNVK